MAAFAGSDCASALVAGPKEPATGAIIRQAELPAGLFPVAWSLDGNAILLDDGAVDSPIWQLAVDNPDELEVLTEDGYLIAVIP